MQRPLRFLLATTVLAVGAGAKQPRTEGGRYDTRTAYRQPPKFTATVSMKGGGVMITTAPGEAVSVNSRFSSPGPVWRLLSGDESTLAGAGWSKVRVESVGHGSWNISAESPDLRLERTVTVHEDHVAVIDSLSVGRNDNFVAGTLLPVAVQVEHNATFMSNVTIVSAEVPGSLYPFSCSTIENQDEFETDGLSYGSFGNPAVYMQSATVGVGLLPLDDVFQIHGVATQSALPVYPRGPRPGCAVTAPPSIQIADRNLGLHVGSTYTQEWAIYPTTQPCNDYYCFINAARKARWGEPSIQLNGTGYLSMNTNLPDVDYSELEDAGFVEPWKEWSNRTWTEFLNQQAMHFITSDIPYTDKAEVCRPQQRLYCTGSCFVHELPAESAAGLRLLIERLRALPNSTATTHPVLMYMDTWLSSETDAATKYKDSRILTKDGTQLTYGKCAKGKDYPLFFGTTRNNYGKELDAYVSKALDFGFAGIYHDDFMLNNVGYTFDASGELWDNVSVVMDPSTLTATRRAASLILLTQEHELSMLQKVRSHGGMMVYNGPPVTRSWTNAVNSDWAMYFAEDGEQCRVRFLHLSTPIALTRYSGGDTDIDPKYNATCKGTSDVSTCIAANILANLDYGVLPFLYDGLFSNGTGPNVLEHMFPIEVLQIEPGVVWGTNRIVTSKSGSFGFAALDDNGEATPQLALDMTNTSKQQVTTFLYYQGFLVRNHSTAGVVAQVEMVLGCVDMAVVVLT
eukprot:COSAG02_NODE_8146_length_2690_cov_3.119259_1_plen_740_part_00